MVVVQRALAQRRDMAAVLLGWTGGKMKHVRRHEKPWHDLGYDTISAAQSIDDTFLHPVFTNLRQTAAATLRAIQDAGTPTIVPHLFSNGGVILWLEVLETARRGGVARETDSQSARGDDARGTHDLDESMFSSSVAAVSRSK